MEPIHFFTDLQGRDWGIAPMSWGMIVKIRSRFRGVDFSKIVEKDDRTFERLAMEPELLVNVLWCTCEAQAEELGVSGEEFGESLGGDVLDQAALALERAAIDFFPPRVRRTLTKLVEKRNQAMDLAMDQLIETVDGPETNQAIDRLVSGAKTSFINTLESLGESVPTPTP